MTCFLISNGCVVLQEEAAQVLTLLTSILAGSTLVVSPYTMAPMSLDGISCGVLQTSGATLESSQALTTSASAATVITAQAAARAANGSFFGIESICSSFNLGE